jgi:hypothetical protein
MLRSLIHVSLAIALATILFFLRLCLNSKGNMLANVVPEAHVDVQNLAVFPLRTVTLVAAANRASSTASTGSSEPHHGLLGDLH